MNVKEILEGMAARAFSASYLDGVCELYDARDNGSTEADYETGMAYNPVYPLCEQAVL